MMTPQQKGVTWTAGAVILGILGAFGGVYVYGSGRESSLAETKAKLDMVQANLEKERQDRIAADNAFREDLKELKDVSYKILASVRRN
jgi:hypothetical protein